MRTRPAVLPWLLLAPATLFLLAVFVRPFAITFADSLSGGDGFLGHYREVLGSVLLRRAMRVTLELAVWTTVVCVLAGYLIAYRLSTMSAARARILLLVILFPALTAVLARLYGWTIVLGRRGPINDWLTKSGLTEDPLPLVFYRIWIAVFWSIGILYATGGRLSGIITETDLLTLLVGGRDRDTQLGEVMVRRVSTVTGDDAAGELPQIFERGEVAIVVDGERRVRSVVTKMDLIEFMATRSKLNAASGKG